MQIIRVFYKYLCKLYKYLCKLHKYFCRSCASVCANLCQIDLLIRNPGSPLDPLVAGPDFDQYGAMRTFLWFFWILGL